MFIIPIALVITSFKPIVICNNGPSRLRLTYVTSHDLWTFDPDFPLLSWCGNVIPRCGIYKLL